MHIPVETFYINISIIWEKNDDHWQEQCLWFNANLETDLLLVHLEHQCELQFKTRPLASAPPRLSPPGDWFGAGHPSATIASLRAPHPHPANAMFSVMDATPHKCHLGTSNRLLNNFWPWYFELHCSRKKHKKKSFTQREKRKHLLITDGHIGWHLLSGIRVEDSLFLNDRRRVSVCSLITRTSNLTPFGAQGL